MSLQEIETYLNTITDNVKTEEHTVTHVSEYDGIKLYCGNAFSDTFLQGKTVIVTHYAKFHMDELLAMCMLLAGPLAETKEVVIIRNRDQQFFDKADYVVDVGRVYDPTTNRFDHHQPGFNITYGDNTSYASAGLVFMKYGELVISNLLTRYADACLKNNALLMSYIHSDMYAYIKYVDNLDNGQKVTTSIAKLGISANWVSNLNPTRMFATSLESDYTHNFIVALTSLRLWFRNYIVKSAAMWLGMQYLDELINVPEITNAPYLIIPYDLPWKELMWKRWNVLSKFSFIIVANRDKSNWSIHHVPTSPNNLRYYKVKIPQELMGKYGAELEEITGIPDLIVCNSSGFVTYAKTKIAAAAFVNYVYKRYMDNLVRTDNNCRVISDM